MIHETGGNVAVMRTFSKAYGLAGARVGYLVADPEVIDALRRIRPPFSVTGPTQAAALAALADTAHLEWVREQTRRGRERLYELFGAAGYEVVPSQANFVLVVAPDAEELQARLERGGVSVRLGANLELPGTVRVTVASDEGFELLLERALLRRDAHAGRRPRPALHNFHRTTSQVPRNRFTGRSNPPCTVVTVTTRQRAPRPSGRRSRTKESERR